MAINAYLIIMLYVCVVGVNRQRKRVGVCFL